MGKDEVIKKRAMTISVDVFVSLVLISLFAYLSIQILHPFVSILIWAAILAVALHPLFLWVKAKFGGRGGISGTVIALAGLLILFLPTVLLVESIIGSLGPLANAMSKGDLSVPPPDDSVKDWPLVGNWVYENWREANEDIKQTLKHFAPQIKKAAAFILSSAGSLAAGVFQFALSIIFAAVMLSHSESLVRLGRQLAGRVAGVRGHAFLDMAGATIRNVSRGVLGIAILQGGLASIGIFAAGIPFPGIFSALVVAASIVQMPILVIVPLIIYVWTAETALIAILFTLYMVPVLLSDNFLKPIFMARGLETPMIVIFIGVIGGTVSSGLIGLFIGPVILAVFYKLILVWMTAYQMQETKESFDLKEEKGNKE
jgi:predicted PurR-regulated permease PerM